ncbi:two-component system sensor histidine kinase NtrB [Desulfobacula sp.]
MKTDKDIPDHSQLSKRAEEKLQEEYRHSHSISEMSPEAMATLIHELEVHQIELKMQNQELRRLHDELETARDTYAHLYDFAPIGYFTVSEKGVIDEANLTFATMLGLDRGALIGTPFHRLVQKEGQDIFYKHRWQFLETETPQTSELRLLNKDGHGFYVRLECFVIRNKADESRQIRGVASDITQIKLMEEKLCQSLKMQPIEIVQVIKDALKSLRSTIPTTIDIDQDIKITDETILADPTQIDQIMTNLCINASHAMEETGGTIKVILENVILDDNSAGQYLDLSSGEHIKIRISDTGPGINPDILGRIFDPYFTTKELWTGSGMGLAVVYGIIKNHNGAITVDNNPGKGAAFNILFPIVKKA